MAAFGTRSAYLSRAIQPTTPSSKSFKTVARTATLGSVMLEARRSAGFRDGALVVLLLRGGLRSPEQRPEVPGKNLQRLVPGAWAEPSRSLRSASAHLCTSQDRGAECVTVRDDVATGKFPTEDNSNACQLTEADHPNNFIGGDPEQPKTCDTVSRDTHCVCKKPDNPAHLVTEPLSGLSV